MLAILTSNCCARKTLERLLAKQAWASSLAHLQLHPDTFRSYFNQPRPTARRRAAHVGRSPSTPHGTPAGPPPTTHFRVRHDAGDKSGRATPPASAASPTPALRHHKRGRGSVRVQHIVDSCLGT
jgi:hypothetical protein